jgi:ABC-2 type transport system ATP-binding protein
MIELKHVYKSYDGEHLVLDDINLIVNDGDIFAFVGLNGAGKSTTIKAICGIHSFDGEILIDGMSIKKNPIECKKNMAYIADNPELYGFMKGVDFIKFIVSMYNKPLDEERMMNLALKLEIVDALNDPISTYSHGMKQKIALMAHFLHDPHILVLDEPFVGLDPKATFELKEMMKEHALNGGVIFFSTHILEVAQKLCNKVAIIKDGKIKACGSMEEITKDSTLEEVFLGVANE